MELHYYLVINQAPLIIPSQKVLSPGRKLQKPNIDQYLGTLYQLQIPYSIELVKLNKVTHVYPPSYKS